MSILLVGLNHHTAPVELRERLALSGCGLTFALAEIPVHHAFSHGEPVGANNDQLPALSEGVILSTCNRLEIYATAHEIGLGKASIENFLSRLQGIPLSEIKPHLYFMHDQSAVSHLMRVAAGLDSMILGEPQILGQVAQSFAKSRTAQTTGPILTHLFEQAVHIGKRARSETEISQHTTSISHAAALLAEEKLGDLSGVNVALVGAGEMAEVAVQALLDRGANHIICLNRTLTSAEALAERFGGQAMPWHDLTKALVWADVVISATGAPHTIIHVNAVQESLPERNGRPLVFIDIALPRDIEEAVGEIPTVNRFDIDDLQHVLDENIAQRQAAVPSVEAIIAEEATTFADWISSQQVVPVIADLRQWAIQQAQAEVTRALNKLEEVSPREQEIIEKLAHRLTNKLLHHPTMTLREQAAQGNGYGYAHVVRELFNLTESNYEANHKKKSPDGKSASSPVLQISEASS
ncbi:glutamyl-tRNA reductase [Chloroflexota bacterium]